MHGIEWQHCKNCTVWPWPTFWMWKLWNVNISETVRASAKKSEYDDFYRFWYLPTNDTIAYAVLRDIDLLFQGKKLEMLICLTVRASATMWIDQVPGILLAFLFSKMQMIGKLFLQICLHLNVTLRRVALLITICGISINDLLIWVRTQALYLTLFRVRMATPGRRARRETR